MFELQTGPQGIAQLVATVEGEELLVQYHFPGSSKDHSKTRQVNGEKAGYSQYAIATNSERHGSNTQ